MISSNLSEAVDLLNKWKEEDRWMGVVTRSPKPELHQFWAKVDRLNSEGVWLAGEWAMLLVPFREDTKFAYLDSREIPPETHSSMA